MPDYPLMPGVLICEAAAQLSSFFCKQVRMLDDGFIAFGGMEDVRFRGQVRPGDRLVLVCKAMRLHRRHTMFDCQGFVGTNMVFHGKIIGVPITGPGDTAEADLTRRALIALDVMSRSRPQIDVSSSLIDPGPADRGLLRSTGRPSSATTDPSSWRSGRARDCSWSTPPRQTPAHNFLGVELSRKYARLCAERLAQREISNAKVWRGDARLVLTRHVPDLSLRAVHVYFPDPWWKKRHKKRRVFTDSLVTQIERTLEPGGQLRVASDVEEYFGLIQGLIAAHPRFQEVPIPEAKQARASVDYLTNFERKYRIEGRPIYRADYGMAPE